MTEDSQSLAQRIEDQTVSSAREFFEASLGRLRDARAQLEEVEEQLPQEEARVQIQELIDSCVLIEGYIEEAARDLGLESSTTGAAPEAGEQARDPVGETVQGAQETVSGTVQGVASAAAGAVGQVGQLAALPGAQLLGRTTDESGRTVQRLVDESGDIIETTLDESGELLDETLVGNLADLPAEEESITEEGHTLRTVRDESGTLIKLHLGPEGSVLDLQIPDNA